MADGSFAYQAVREFHWIESLQVLQRFTSPEESDRHLYRPAQCDHTPTLGCAVQLGDHESRKRHRRCEYLRLANRVLSYCGVEHEQRSVRRPGPPLPHNPHDLLEFLAQTLIGVEPTGRIDEHGIDAPRRRRLDRIERDRGRITP